MSNPDLVDGYVSALPGRTRRLGGSEWGITVQPEAAGGWPLDVGLRMADGMLRAQAFVAPADAPLDPWVFLHWNRQTRFVRFACASNGDLWVHADLGLAGVDEQAVDRLLGLLVEGAVAARRYVSAARRRRGAAAPGPSSGWRAAGA